MGSRKRIRKGTFCPMIEHLEDRCTPSTSGVPITINASPAPIFGYEFTGTVNQKFTSETLYASGGSGSGYQFSQAVETKGDWPMPPGLQLSSKGVIYGTPTRGGLYNVAFQVTDSAGDIDTTVYQFLISDPVFSVSTTMKPLNALNSLQYNNQTLPLGITDQPYNATVTATSPITDPIKSVQIQTENSKGTLYAAGSNIPGINVATNGNIYTITGLDGINGPALTISWTPSAVAVTGTPTFSAAGISYPLFLSVTFQNDLPGQTTATQNFNFSFGYSPQEIESAYDFNGVGNGAGQTIVILEIGGSPNLVSSTDPNFANSDLNQFDQIFPGLNTFGQPGGPVFLKLNQSAGSTYNTNTYPPPASVPEEEIQDIEWVHALAPMANIVAMESKSITTAGLYTVEQPNFLSNLETQQGLPAPRNGSLFVVGTSDGGSIDSATPLSGITYVESSGDFENHGTGTSGNVVLTGYTQLTESPTSSYVSEAAVNGVAVPYYKTDQGGILQSGGGTELGKKTSGGTFVAAPQQSYQSGIYNQFPNGTTLGRVGPDVSFNGDPVSGDVEFNSAENSFRDGYDKGGGPWDVGWGTSIASPSWDAIFAIANQGRAALGKPSLSGTAQTLPMLYSLAGTPAFHQISTGLQGTGGTQSLYTIPSTSGGAIYNIRGGLGSPVANVLIPDLIGPTLTANSGLWAGGGLTGSPLTLTITGSNFSSSAAYSGSFNNGVTGTVTYSSPTTLIVSNLTGLSGLAPGTPLMATVTMTVPVGSTTYKDTSGAPAEAAPIPLNLSNTIYVQNLYTLLLHRSPDPGAATWVNLLNAGTSPATVIQDIEQSPEYLNDVVTALYQHYLNRAPDPGAQGWVTALENGSTIEQVIAGLVSSPEFFQDAGGSNSGYVNALYYDILGRVADSGGYTYWTNALNGGESPGAVARSFLTSTEYRQDLVAGVGWTLNSPVPTPPTIYFQGYYLTFLYRPGDTNGVAYWVSQLQAGVTNQQVLAGILGSMEGYAE